MSLAEAAAWTWHAGADDDAAKVAAKAAAHRRVSAAMAAATATPSASHSASHRSTFADIALQVRTDLSCQPVDSVGCSNHVIARVHGPRARCRLQL